MREGQAAKHAFSPRAASASRGAALTAFWLATSSCGRNLSARAQKGVDRGEWDQSARADLHRLKLILFDELINRCAGDPAHLRRLYNGEGAPLQYLKAVGHLTASQ